jgi:hypothetical protein
MGEFADFGECGVSGIHGISSGWATEIGEL